MATHGHGVIQRCRSPKHRGPGARGALGWFIAIIFVSLVALIAIVGKIRSPTNQSSGPSIDYSGVPCEQSGSAPCSGEAARRGFAVIVSGSHRGIEFTGNYGWMERGRYRSRSVEGKTPMAFEIADASSLSVFFQINGTYGDITLTVEMFKNGRLVATESTSASYGVVTIASP